jgi:hypothetical protein
MTPIAQLALWLAFIAVGTICTVLHDRRVARRQARLALDKRSTT